MALNAPTLVQIANNIIDDITAKLGQAVPLLAKAVFRVMAYAFSGIWLLLYKKGVWQYNQIFPQLASEKYLELLGENKRVVRDIGVAWEGYGQIVVLQDGVISAGTQAINNLTGVIYVVTVSTNVTVPLEAIPLKATVLGEITALVDAQIIDFVSPLGIVDSEIEIIYTGTPAADKEDLEDYRARVLDAYQKQPQGGALADYEKWAEETPDVINAYPYSGTYPSDVFVYIEVDNQVDGIPTAPQLAAVLLFILYDPITELQDRKPVGAFVEALAITRKPFNVDITGLSPDTPEVRSAIETVIVNYFLGKEPYILGLALERKDQVTSTAVTSAAEGAASALGSIFDILVLKDGSNPITNWLLIEGQKAKLGTLTWL